MKPDTSLQACRTSSPITTLTGDSTVDTRALGPATIAVVVVTPTIETKDDSPPRPRPPVVDIHHHTFMLINVSLLKIMRMTEIAMILISTSNTVEIAPDPTAVVVSEKAETMKTTTAPTEVTTTSSTMLGTGMTTSRRETARTSDPTLERRKKDRIETKTKTERKKKRKRKRSGTVKGISMRR